MSEGKTDALVYFAFDLLFDGSEDLRQLPLTHRKQRLDQMVESVSEDPLIRYVTHFETGGKRFCVPPVVFRWKASFPNRRTPAMSQVVPTAGSSPNAVQAMKW